MFDQVQRDSYSIQLLRWEQLNNPVYSLYVHESGIIVDACQNLHARLGYGWRDSLVNPEAPKRLEMLLPPHMRQHHQRLLEGFFAAPRPRSMGGRGSRVQVCLASGQIETVEISLMAVDLWVPIEAFAIRPQTPRIVCAFLEFPGDRSYDGAMNGRADDPLANQPRAFATQGHAGGRDGPKGGYTSPPSTVRGPPGVMDPMVATPSPSQQGGNLTSPEPNYSSAPRYGTDRGPPGWLPLGNANGPGDGEPAKQQHSEAEPPDYASYYRR